MEKLENLAGTFGADAGNLAEVGDRGPLDFLQGSEVMQQGTLARWPDAGNFLQPGLADVLLAKLAMRADHKAMRLVAQPLDEIQHGIARLELYGLAAMHEQGLAPRVAVRPLGHRQQLTLGQSKASENLLHRVELAAAPVDDHEVRPLR